MKVHCLCLILIGVAAGTSLAITLAVYASEGIEEIQGKMIACSVLIISTLLFSMASVAGIIATLWLFQCVSSDISDIIYEEVVNRVIERMDPDDTQMVEKEESDTSEAESEEVKMTEEENGK